LALCRGFKRSLPSATVIKPTTAIVDAATGAFEVGIGTYTASGTTLSRDTVLESSNANALVSFSSGTKDVFVTYPADRSVSQADIGTEPNEIPLNQYLGSLAYQDLNSVTIDGGVATLDTATITSIQNDTAISNVEPSLMLNFAAVKKLDPRITYARASTATYYDGVTNSKAEENLFSYSQEFDNAAWSKTNITVTANSTTAPDGTTTAESILETATTGQHQVLRGLTQLSGTYVTSIFAKANGRNWLAINTNFASVQRVSFFDLENGVVGSVPVGFTASIVDVGDGWYRCVVVGPRGINAYPGIFATALSDGDPTVPPSYAGDITKGLFLWGAQFEARDAVSSYTPTTTPTHHKLHPRSTNGGKWCG
jgi:hypothetical protein